MTKQGKIKWFNPDKGFGFIRPHNGKKDVFIHISAVNAAGLQTLNDDQEIEYEVVEERGKKAANNIKLI